MSFRIHPMEPKGHTMRTEHLSQTDLIISVIETTQRGNELNDAHQRLLTSLSEIADSRGTWGISFSTKDKACEFLKVKQSSFNFNEKPIDHSEKKFSDVIRVLDPDDTTSDHFYLLVKDVESFDCKPKKQDNLGCVVIVVGVDLSVLKKAHFAVTHDIPVVFIQGSGSEADLMAACRNQNERSTDNDKEECHHLLKDILKETKYVNIYSQSEPTDIQYAILLALKKAHHSPSKLLLSLAWRWKKIDFAENEILKQFPDPMSASDETNVTIADTLFETLANDQADFVELLLRAELKVKNEDLQTLYSDVLDRNAASGTMTMFIQNQLHWIQPNKDNIQPRTSSELSLSRVGNLLNAYLNKMCNPYNDTERPIGFVDLFLFAIIFNRQRLGELMWRHCQDKLGTALVACAILKAFANTAGCYVESELSTDLINHARDYERKAIGVLTECYKKDKIKAHDILIKTLEKPFDKIRPLELANRYHLEEFMGHECCQTKLNIIWRGKITGHMRWWKILLALFMPIFIFWIKFTTNNGPFKHQTLCCKKHKKKQGQSEMDFYLNTYPSSKPQLYSFLHKNKERNINIIDAMYYLYTAPLSVYTFNIVSYVIFMLYFSHFIIVDLNEATSFQEYTLWVWALTMLFEETRECFFVPMNKTPGCCGRIRGWFGSHWNKFDLFINIMFITTIAMRYALSGNDFQYVRFLYSVTVGLYFMRFLQAALVSEKIGPKVIMLSKMVADLFYFMGIFGVVFFSFCVMYQANMYPNSPPSVFLWPNFFHTPFWQIFGELFLENFIPGSPYRDCDPNATSAGDRWRCAEANRAVIFLAGLYLILTHLILVNLLIATFSHTFASVQEKSGHIWKYYWYGIVREYSHRAVLCPPLIILVHIYRTLRYVVCRRGDFKYDSEFRLKDKEGFYSELLLKFADAAAERYLQQNKNAANLK